MTPFPPFGQQDDESDKWRAALGLPLLSAPALSDPTMAPQMPDPMPAPELHHDNPLAALAANTQRFDAIGPPPQATGPDKGQLALAMFADLLMNKGRSLGPLVGSMAQGDDAVAKENYDRRMSDALHHAQLDHLQRESHLDPEALANRKRALDLQSRGLDIQEKTLGARTEAQTGARDAALALGADPKMIEGMTDAQVNAWKSAITGQLRQQGSNEAWDARETQRQIHEHQKEDRQPALRAAITTATTNARNDATIGSPDEAIANFQAANPKLEVSDPGTFISNARNNRGAAQRQKALMTATRALDASARLRTLDQAYSDIPLFERAGGQAQQIKAEYDKLVNEHQGIITQISGMGAGSEADRAEIKDGIPSILNPLAHNKLAGIERMLHLNVAATLGPYGIGIRGEPHGTAQEAPPPDDGTSGLQTTQGAGPRVDQTVSPPGGPVKIRKPDGTVGYVPAQNLKRALELGAELVE